MERKIYGSDFPSAFWVFCAFSRLFRIGLTFAPLRLCVRFFLPFLRFLCLFAAIPIFTPHLSWALTAIP